jgi:uncharacterized peroxidase-related enzyme
VRWDTARATKLVTQLGLAAQSSTDDPSRTGTKATHKPHRGRRRTLALGRRYGPEQGVLASLRLLDETAGMFIDAVSEDAATGALAGYYRQQRATWGFLPNYAGAFSTRPDVAQAWNTLNATVREGMDRRRFELVTIAAARALRSTYCTAAHSKFIRDVCGDEATLYSIAQEPSGAALAPLDRAVYQFAAKVAVEASSIGQPDVDQLRAAGLTDAEIADIVFAVSARSFFTRVLDALGAQLDCATAETFSAVLLESMLVGRPIADS